MAAPTRPTDRAAAIVASGLQGTVDAATARTLETLAHDDTDARVRAAALGALVRSGPVRTARRAWRAALDDADPAVRRRAAELTVDLLAPARPVVALLDDNDVTVVEAAAWALGELGPATARSGAVAALARVATGHDDALAREAAVAALGAIGSIRGLPAILAACRDKPQVRRRAVLALAPFEGPKVDAALSLALADADWQVRQAAEDLTRE